MLRMLVMVAAILVCMDATHVVAETITVDFGVVKGQVTYRASGFLHGISVEAPDDQWVRQLKPGLFRLSPSAAFDPLLYQRVKSYGAAVQVVISDSYGYPGLSGAWPGDGGDWTGWEYLVEHLVQNADAKGLDAVSYTHLVYRVCET